MTCKFCGEEMPENGKFCPCCGADNTADETQTPPPEEETVDAAQQSTAFAHARKMKRLAAVSGCIAVMAVLALVLFFGIKGGKLDVKSWFDWEIFRENSIFKQDDYTVKDSKAEKKADTVVATMGESKLTNGLLQIYYQNEIYNYMNTYYYYIYMGVIDLDCTAPLDDQECALKKGYSWQQFFLEIAIDTWREYENLYQGAKKANFQLPEKYRSDLDAMGESLKTLAAESGYDSADELLAAEFGSNVDTEDYITYMERYYVAELYLDSLVDAVEVTDQNLEDYFKEHEDTLKKNNITKDSGVLVDLRQILLKPATTKDEKGNTVITEQAWAECEQKAQALIEKYRNGEQTADNFAALDSENLKNLENVAKNSLTTIDVRHILIKCDGKENDDGSITFTNAEKAAEAKAKAEEILAKWLENPTEENFGALAKEHTQDSNGEAGGLYTDVTEGKMVTSFNDWCFDASRKSGDYGIVETRFGYHIMYFVHRDDAVEQWGFADGRKEGDTTLVKTDDGYALLYYVASEEGWIRYSRQGIRYLKASELRSEYASKGELKVTYSKIALAYVPLQTSSSAA